MKGNYASVDEINKFLIEYKSCLEDGVEFIPRTYKGLTILGLDIELAKDELKGLTYKDFDRGPTRDHNGDGTDIWEFGKEIEGVLTYIKIKLTNTKKCKVLSFKPSNGPFTRPYK
ncbi:type II toxin-antitoxin system MqsR family toxin [Staphylococcus haemolyticus]|uniref:type II toxin-antitoxin system MqsR family toxin n=1 Tax=Staphylococcus haemolyticus TaxID=1283 RepID=UPI00069E8BE2|nr:type II toxin-antitoxin system MqsR family toxin [Staphylococcus haemolyticus]